jgi:hypothetical protein
MAFPDIVIGSSFDAKGFRQAETAATKLNKTIKNLAGTFGIAFGTKAIVNFGKASVKAFVEDVDDHFKFWTFMKYEWYYPIRNKIKRYVNRKKVPLKFN